MHMPIQIPLRGHPIERLCVFEVLGKTDLIGTHCAYCINSSRNHLRKKTYIGKIVIHHYNMPLPI
jgi:hypothetical protein